MGTEHEKLVEPNLLCGAHADGKNFSRKPNCDKILCPVMAALYNNGDLEVGEDGATMEQLSDGFKRTGCNSSILIKAIAGLAKDRPLNIFDMGVHEFHEGNQEEELKRNQMGGMMAPVAHKTSSGLRNPAPDENKFKEFVAQYGIGKEGEKIFTARELGKIVHDGRNDPERIKLGNPQGPDAFLGTWAAMLDVFGRRDEKGRYYLTEADLHALFIESKYPDGWDLHEWTLSTCAGRVLAVKRQNESGSVCCSLQ